MKAQQELTGRRRNQRMSIIDERLEEIRIVPVVKIERAEDAKGLAGAHV